MPEASKTSFRVVSASAEETTGVYIILYMYVLCIDTTGTHLSCVFPANVTPYLTLEDREIQ